MKRYERPSHAIHDQKFFYPWAQGTSNTLSKGWRRGGRFMGRAEMKVYTRKASASWLGTHQHGKGAITTPSGFFDAIPYFFASNGKRGRTNPPELIAAAHAGSFSMSLANELGTAGFSPTKIDTTSIVTMEPFAGRWRMTQIHLDVVATVARVIQCDFVGAALRAKANCAISQLLSANISMSVKLNRRGTARLLPHRESPEPSGTLNPKKKSTRPNVKR